MKLKKIKAYLTVVALVFSVSANSSGWYGSVIGVFESEHIVSGRLFLPAGKHWHIVYDSTNSRRSWLLGSNPPIHALRSTLEYKKYFWRYMLKMTPKEPTNITIHVKYQDCIEIQRRYSGFFGGFRAFLGFFIFKNPYKLHTQCMLINDSLKSAFKDIEVAYERDKQISKDITKTESHIEFLKNETIALSPEDMAQNLRIHQIYMEIDRLKDTIPQLFNTELDTKKKENLMYLKSLLRDERYSYDFSEIQHELLKLSKLYDPETTEHLFFTKLIEAFEEIAKELRKNNQRFKAIEYSFQRNNKDLTMDERTVHDLVLLMDLYTRTGLVHELVDKWLGRTQFWMDKRATSANILDHLFKKTGHFLHLPRIIKSLKSIMDEELDPQLMHFYRIFIQGVGFADTREEEMSSEEVSVDSLQTVSDVRESIAEMDIFISKWLHDTYTLGYQPDLLELLNYETRVQKYLKNLDKYISSERKRQKIHTFITEVEEFLNQNTHYKQSPLVPFINEVKTVLLKETQQRDQEIKQAIQHSIKAISDLFGDLKQQAQKKYHAAPFNMITSFLEGRYRALHAHMSYQHNQSLLLKQQQHQQRVNNWEKERNYLEESRYHHWKDFFKSINRNLSRRYIKTVQGVEFKVISSPFADSENLYFHKYSKGWSSMCFGAKQCMKYGGY